MVPGPSLRTLTVYGVGHPWMMDAGAAMATMRRSAETSTVEEEDETEETTEATEEVEDDDELKENKEVGEDEEERKDERGEEDETEETTEATEETEGIDATEVVEEIDAEAVVVAEEGDGDGALLWPGERDRRNCCWETRFCISVRSWLSVSCCVVKICCVFCEDMSCGCGPAAPCCGAFSGFCTRAMR